MHKTPPGMDPLAVGLITAISPLLKGSQAEIMAATEEFELTLSQMRMLFVLEHDGAELAVNALAERVSLSMAAAGRAVDALVRGGLLSRREDDLDRRVKRIALTPAGSDAIEKIGTARLQAAERFVRSLGAADRTALADAVQTIAALTTAYFPGACHPTKLPDPDTSA